MKQEESYVRRIDDLGRVMLPKTMLKEIFGTDNTFYKPLEVKKGKNNTIILTPCKDNEKTR